LNYPVWSSKQVLHSSVPYPGIVLCPPFRTVGSDVVHQKVLSSFNLTACEYSTQDYAVENCGGTAIPIQIFLPTSKGGLNITLDCLGFNLQSNDSIQAYSSFSFFFIELSFSWNSSLHANSSSFPLMLSLYDPQYESPSALRPDILVAANTTNMILLDPRYSTYLNNTMVRSYDLTMSSSRELSSKTAIILSFSSLLIMELDEGLSETFINVIGQLVGALAFTKAAYGAGTLLLIALIAKIIEKCDDLPFHHHHHGHRHQQERQSSVGLRTSRSQEVGIELKSRPSSSSSSPSLTTTTSSSTSGPSSEGLSLLRDKTPSPQ